MSNCSSIARKSFNKHLRFFFAPFSPFRQHCKYRRRMLEKLALIRQLVVENRRENSKKCDSTEKKDNYEL